MFYILPPELTDRIYHFVGEGHISAHDIDTRVPLPAPVYDSLSSFDLYIWEQQISCTLSSNKLDGFLGRYRRMGRNSFHDDFPVLDAIPLIEGDLDFVERLAGSIQALPMLPYLLQPAFIYPYDIHETTPDIIGRNYYETILDQKLDLVHKWQYILNRILYTVDDHEVFSHRRRMKFASTYFKYNLF